MTSRRDFLASATATTALAVAPALVTTACAPGMPQPPRIRRLVRRDDTILRHGGVGDNWHMTWAADGNQYAALCDGTGFDTGSRGFCNSRLVSIAGGPEAPAFGDVPGYPDLIQLPGETATRYYGFGTLALDGRIYQFLSTWNHPLAEPGLRFVGAKLIWSPDNGRNWHNQDGSTPVRWEGWDERKALTFMDEPGQAFSLTSILQMGRGYEQNRDGHVYVYAPNGNTEGTMNQLALFRVARDRILDRSAYEYFASREADGTARWTRDIEQRGVVHTFPAGRVNRTLHPYAWQPSVTWNAPLGLYMMANWGMGVAGDGGWFGKPSYLGFWTAPEPWGPWTQVHEEQAWTPGGDARARAYSPIIAPKWIAPDGKSFWLVWTDYQAVGETAELDALIETTTARRARGESVDASEWEAIHRAIRRTMPYYAFNAQKVEIELAG